MKIRDRLAPMVLALVLLLATLPGLSNTQGDPDPFTGAAVVVGGPLHGFVVEGVVENIEDGPEPFGVVLDDGTPF
jgi:hypothetical protein